MAARVGVDVGGTFTDIIVVSEDELSVWKHPSTPGDPAEGVLDGLETVIESGVSPSCISSVDHGTTVATNAVLEESWADTTLVTTAGCRDVLEIGRQDRPDIYDLSTTRPPPVVPRDRRLEIEERLDERGEVLRELATADVDSLVDRVRATEPDAVAISLLFSFENDDHERAIAERLQTSLDVPIARSSVVLPEIREYERTLATALNAALQPAVSTYVDTLRSQLTGMDIEAPLRLMQSHGGAVAADHVAKRPVTALLSGPAAGVEGGAHIGDIVGHDDILTMDMGGTSCDVSLVEGGQPTVSTDVEVGPYHVAMPMVEIETIGAGGGSIAWVDAGDALRVGPRSAGADPGPICYGRGGQEPTVTDAHAVLGRLDPTLLDGTTPEEAGLYDAFEQTTDGDDSVEEIAQGVIDIANASMSRALRVVSVERGYDPRTFALVAFGGAGPLHAGELAARLEIPRVIIPPMAGVLSALGLLVADRVHEFSQAHVRRLATVDPSDISETLSSFADQGRERLRDEGVSPDDVTIEPALDMRYVGQTYDIRVPLPEWDGDTMRVDLAEAFHAAHERRYGHASPTEPVELVTIRLRARGRVRAPVWPGPPETGNLDRAQLGERELFYNGTWYDATVYERELLAVGVTVTGPAVVQDTDTTIFIPPTQVGTIHESGALVLEAST